MQEIVQQFTKKHSGVDARKGILITPFAIVQYSALDRTLVEAALFEAPDV